MMLNDTSWRDDIRRIMCWAGEIIKLEGEHNPMSKRSTSDCCSSCSTASFRLQIHFDAKGSGLRLRLGGKVKYTGQIRRLKSCSFVLRLPVDRFLSFSS